MPAEGFRPLHLVIEQRLDREMIVRNALLPAIGAAQFAREVIERRLFADAEAAQIFLVPPTVLSALTALDANCPDVTKNDLLGQRHDSLRS
ncbi:hypothetical protein [Antarcticirhabdus aurantiaca]|uniref:hypothetical protein n=1 Tax=Antarcticirhabdus aurantiaca TaxID=2606717 RepID=UPI00131BB31A|nr:hypothetical protein [Antarcticirhabdus aurantiaca]